MFKSARIKLTGWYLLIITLVSIGFSLGICRIMTAELDRMERIRRPRFEENFPRPPLEEIKQRIKLSLIIINLIILSGSAAMAWFLSGKTLHPIKEMVEEQNRFISDASHELKTPLTALKAEIEVNLRNKTISLVQAKKLLQSNLEEVNKLQCLSENLLKLSQNPNINKEIVDLKQISQEAVRKIKPLADKKKIRIINQIKGNVKGDRAALTELLVIFLDNSVKYSSNKTKIWLRAKRSGNLAEITIIDQGVGIDQADVPNIFDRFFRADQSRTKNQTSGYGLGLAIAKKIMDQHQGIIQVKSKVNQGTTFKLIFEKYAKN